MTARRFALDTNILIYAADNTAATRHDLAFELLARARRCDCIVTLQALAEFYAAVTRKRIVAARAAVDQVLDWMTVFAIASADPTALRTALRHSSAGQCSFWDGLMIATAAQAGCRFILSEDMHDGMTIGGVTVRHPFADAALAPDVERLLAST